MSSHVREGEISAALALHIRQTTQREKPGSGGVHQRVSQLGDDLRKFEGETGLNILHRRVVHEEPGTLTFTYDNKTYLLTPDGAILTKHFRFIPREGNGLIARLARLLEGQGSYTKEEEEVSATEFAQAYLGAVEAHIQDASIGHQRLDQVGKNLSSK